MDLEVVRKCAEIAAQQRKSALGVVDEDIQALLDELNAPLPEEAPPPVKATRKAK